MQFRGNRISANGSRSFCLNAGEGRGHSAMACRWLVKNRRTDFAGNFRWEGYVDAVGGLWRRFFQLCEKLTGFRSCGYYRSSNYL